MIINQSTNETLHPKAFKSEQTLQEAIQRWPNILQPVTDMSGPGVPLFIIGREISLGAGPMDFLAMDFTGTLYIIETKLAKNPELKRSVIGQVVDYAQRLAQTDYETLSRRCSPSFGDGTGLAAAAQAFFADKMTEISDAPGLSSATDYQKAIANGLQNGRFIAVVIADHVSWETQQLFSYLNSLTEAKVTFVVLEINRYAIGTVEVLHSNIVWGANYVKRSSTTGKELRAAFMATFSSRGMQSLIEFVADTCTSRGLIETIYPSGISWKGESGGSICVDPKKLTTNWATLPKGHPELEVLRQEALKAAPAAGLQTIGGIYKGLKLRLDSSVKRETVEKFLALALPIQEKAQALTQN